MFNFAHMGSPFKLLGYYPSHVTYTYFDITVDWVCAWQNKLIDWLKGLNVMLIFLCSTFLCHFIGWMQHWFDQVVLILKPKLITAQHINCRRCLSAFTPMKLRPTEESLQKGSLRLWKRYLQLKFRDTLCCTKTVDVMHWQIHKIYLKIGS